MRKVEVKLKGHSGMNCHVEIDASGHITFVSYTTKVVECEPTPSGFTTVIPAGQYWDSRVYTPTTAKQISYFLREYFPDIKYADFKELAIANIKEETTAGILSEYSAAQYAWMAR